MPTNRATGKAESEPPSRLPLLDEPPAERADAARNRTRILATAERILGERGPEKLTMNAVAAAAGVGVGTIYRRFGDQGGLIEAMMNERESRLQQAIMSGSPPLGPGAPAIARIRAFLYAYADLLDTYGPLMTVAEESMPADRRYGSGAYAVHRNHLETLIRHARDDVDAPYLAHALLAPLAAGLFGYQRHDLRMSLDRVKAGLDDLLRGLEPPEPSA